MKIRSLSTVVAATVAATVGVVAPAQPAQAAIPWGEIISAVVTIATSSGGGGGGLEQAKREIIAAIDQSQQEILDHIDAIVEGDIRGCTEAAVTGVAQIDSMPDHLLGPFINSSVECAADSAAHFSSVQSLAAADNIGHMIGITYPVAMIGYSTIGLSTVDLLRGFIRAYENVVNKLEPECRETTTFYGPGLESMILSTICTAYNGTRASHIQDCPLGNCSPGPDHAQMKEEAAVGTSWLQAKQSLPVLRDALAQATGV